MLNNIIGLNSLETDLLIQDHKKFLILMADVAGCSISESGWARAKSYLSPAFKFDVPDPIMMTTKLFEPANIFLYKYTFYKERKKLKLYVTYQFAENATCFEFLLRGAPMHLKQSSDDIPDVVHSLMRGVDDPNAVYGLISIQAKENSEAADTLFERVLNTLQMEVTKNDEAGTSN